MKTRKKVSPLWFRRSVLPVVTLIKYTAAVAFSLIILFLGIRISFRGLITPFAAVVARVWNQLIGGLVRQDSLEVTNHILGGVLLVTGAILAYRSIRVLFRQVLETISPGSVGGVADTYRRKQQLANGPKIVAIGGGTGLSTLLRGLKLHSSNITAIVTVTDDGGSSGRIVQEMGMIPPGDMRNCLVALADAEKLMTDLFQHRFTATSGALSGHSLGNLLIAGFVDQSAGDVDEALKMASEVLNIRGRVIPSTTDHVQLRAVMEDGSEIVGETAIVESSLKVRRVYVEPENARPHPEALAAIREADIICIGPGSVYTSVIPNLLIPEIAEAINQADCHKVYVCNVMTQPGESEQFTAAEHLVVIQANIPCKVFDYALVNTGVPTSQTLDRYRVYNQDLVVPDIDRIRAMGIKPVTGNFMNETDYVRHDPVRVASRLMDILYR